MKCAKLVSGIISFGVFGLALAINFSLFAQSGPPALPPLPQGRILDVWDFSGTNFLSEFHYAPTSLTNVLLVPTWNGNGLQVDDTNAAWVVYPVVEPTGHTNLDLAHGTVETWLSPDWNSTDGLGAWGTIFEVGNWSTNLATATGALGLFISPDGSNLFFSAQTNSVSTNFLNAPISWNAGDWHHVLITYSETNSELYLEGQFVTNGPGVSVVLSAEVLSNGLSIGSDSGTGLLQSRAVYNQFITYNYQLDADTIAEDYAYDSQNVYPLPSRGGRFSMDDSGPPGFPGDGGTNGGGGTPFYSPVYGSNDFWVEPLPLGTNIYTSATNAFTVLVHGTYENVPIQLQYKTNLADPTWMIWGNYVGAADNYFTPIILSTTGYSNLFFRVLNYTLDSQQTGMPDWWQKKYFGYIGVDPNGDPENDGYSNLYKYLNGMNPNVFYTPPAVTGVNIVLNTNGTAATLTWNPASGTVTQYVIKRADPVTNEFGFVDGLGSYQTIGTTTNSTFVDSGSFFTSDPLNQFSYGSSYQVVAQYPGTNYSSTEGSPMLGGTFNPKYSVNASLVRGPYGRWQLAFSAIAPGVQSIQISWQEWDLFYDLSDGTLSSQVISTNDLVNGCYVIPDEIITNYLGYNAFYTYGYNNLFNTSFGNVSDIAFVQGLGPNGQPGPLVQAGTVSGDAPYGLDGRQHLQDSAAFLVQAAGLTQPYSPITQNAYQDFFQLNTNFVEISFIHPGLTAKGYGDNEFVPYMGLDNVFPIIANYTLAQWLYTTNPAPPYSYQPDFSTPPVSALTQNGSYQSGPYWIAQDTGNLSDFGASVSGDGHTVSLESGTHNIFGLAVGTSLGVGGGIDPDTGLPFGEPQNIEIAPGGSTSFDQDTLAGYYSHFQTNTLNIVDYYFAPIATPGTDLIGLTTPAQKYPLPVTPDFAVSNETPVIIGAVGKPMVIGAWAKEQIGSGSKYAYVGQYFDTNSYVISNGYTYTNISAGIVSPYGELFPTRAGIAVLNTLPGAGRTNIGQVQIYAMKLCLDAKHNENSGASLDLTSYGRDMTSTNLPFVYWLNNNFDRWNYVDCAEGYLEFSGCDQEQDDLASGDCPLAIGTVTPDSDYKVSLYGYAIPSTKDLEDYTRLWIPGLASLYQANTNLTFQLIVRNNDSTDGPAINIFQAVETNGGIAFLTNETVAQAQIANPTLLSVGRVGPSDTINLNSYFALANGASDYFIWCGARRGKGELVLQILNGTNLIAETSAWIQLKDIREMFERYTVGDDANVTPYATAIRAGEDLPSGIGPFKYDAPDDSNTPYILFVHGWNMTRPQKDKFASTAYKRLYWQGYQGRFGLFRWPTGYNFPAGELSEQAFSPDNFDNSELTSWESGAPLRKLLVGLDSKYAGKVYMFAHSHGNIAAGEALRTNTTLVQTYIAMQAAVASHAYDTNTTNRIMGTANVFDKGYPERTGQYWTNGAPCYFNGVTGAANYINFYNRNDWALSWWESDQNTKPDALYSCVPVTGALEEYFYAGITGTRSLTFPTNTYEIFSYITQGRCYALGEQVNVNGVFDPIRQVNLANPPYSFGSAHKGHSAEFRSDNMSRASFWNAVLQSMDISP